MYLYVFMVISTAVTAPVYRIYKAENPEDRESFLSLAPEKRKADMTEASRGMRMPILHQYRIQNHRTQTINR